MKKCPLESRLRKVEEVGLYPFLKEEVVVNIANKTNLGEAN